MLKRLALIVLMTNLYAQDLPDAPNADRNPVEVRESQRKCGPWRCYQLQTIPTRDVFKSKAFWATWMGDVMISSFDAEMTHAGQAYHHCYERNVNPPVPSRWDLYRNNLPENAAAGVVSFVWVKVKGPKWIMPAFLTGPVVGHVFKGGLTWYENCW